MAGGCGAGDAENGSGAGAGRTDVVAAFYPLAFAAERIGGPSVDVTNVTPPGAEPHDVELSPREIDRIRSADIVLYLGGGFQPAVEEAASGADGRAVDLLEQALPIAAEEESGHEDHEETGLDPHVWLDPLRFADIAERIGRELDRSAAARMLGSDLRALHAEFEQGLADCDRHEFVTSHAAFGYLADRYRLEQIAISGLSPEAEPSPRELEDAIEHVRESGATTVFFETLVSPRVAETVARETGARTGVLDPLEGLSAGELADGADYLSVMRENLAALRTALSCR